MNRSLNVVEKFLSQASDYREVDGPFRQSFSRYTLPEILDDCLFEVGAEIGVEHGYFSYYLLRHSQLKCLHSIDAFTGKFGKWRRDAESLLAEFLARSIIHPKSSREVAHEFAANGTQLDFVYIDADHRYKSVKEDIQLWWPLIRPGGLLSGHDYCEPATCGVIQAVNEFVNDKHLPLFITREAWASWLVFKPE